MMTQGGKRGRNSPPLSLLLDPKERTDGEGGLSLPGRQKDVTGATDGFHKVVQSNAKSLWVPLERK